MAQVHVKDVLKCMIITIVIVVGELCVMITSLTQQRESFVTCSDTGRCIPCIPFACNWHRNACRYTNLAAVGQTMWQWMGSSWTLSAWGPPLGMTCGWPIETCPSPRSFTVLNSVILDQMVCEVVCLFVVFNGTSSTGRLYRAIDDLRHSGCGLHNGSYFIGCVVYADDNMLLSCSCQGIQRLVDICMNYGKRWDICFTSCKTQCITFGGDNRKTFNIILNHNKLEWCSFIKYLGCYFRVNSCYVDMLQ